ncbi:hypothetical protein V1512DRAFT_266961 [Lipomyces arxii]|uniref:uncharacterized protein n=1 Tax=Lipomyces arxii TaxID=56418 RepID=UPI0034CEC626
MRRITSKISGILPKKREILKFPKLGSKHRIEGYADGVKHPRGCTRDPIYKPMPNIAQLLDKTVAPPTTKNSRTVKTAKSKLADLRRHYYENAIVADYDHHQKVMQFQELAAERDRARNAEQKDRLTNNYLETIFTLPTLDSYVKTYRAPQTVAVRGQNTLGAVENRLYSAKLREQQSQRLQFMAKRMEHQSTKIVDLYHNADSFIVTLDDLNKHVDAEFADGKDQQIVNYSQRSITGLVDARISSNYAPMTSHGVYSEFIANFLGITPAGKPGLLEVKQSLNAKPNMFE